MTLAELIVHHQWVCDYCVRAYDLDTYTSVSLYPQPCDVCGNLTTTWRQRTDLSYAREDMERGMAAAEAWLRQHTSELTQQVAPMHEEEWNGA